LGSVLASSSNINFVITVASGLTANNAAQLRMATSGTTYLELSSEL
jgi:hypothetical protein